MGRAFRAVAILVPCLCAGFGCSVTLVGDPGPELSTSDAGPDATSDATSDAVVGMDADSSAGANKFRDVKGIAAFGMNVYVSHRDGVSRCGSLSADGAFACEHAVLPNAGALVANGTGAQVVAGNTLLRCGDGSAQFGCIPLRTITELATSPPVHLAITDDLTVVWTSASSKILYRAPSGGPTDGAFDTGRTGAPVAVAGNRIFVGLADGAREVGGSGELKTGAGFEGASFLRGTAKRLAGVSAGGISFAELETPAVASELADGSVGGFAFTDAAAYWTLPITNEIVRAPVETTIKVTRRPMMGSPVHIAATSDRLWYTIKGSSEFDLRADAP